LAGDLEDTSFLGVDRGSFSRASVADCDPFGRILAFLPRLANKLAGPFLTTEDMEDLVEGLGGMAICDPVKCGRRAKEGYGKVDGTSEEDISTSPARRSTTLCASGRIGKVMSDIAELPDTSRECGGPTGTGPSVVITGGP
jgi:hypothetical protein